MNLHVHLNKRDGVPNLSFFNRQNLIPSSELYSTAGWGVENELLGQCTCHTFSEPVGVAATMLEPLKIVLIASTWCQ